MPIRPELRHHYTRAAGWPQVCERIRARAGERCECSGQCGGFHRGRRCGAPHLTWVARPLNDAAAWAVVAQGAVVEGARVLRIVLGVAHLDHDPSHNDDANLLLLCQRCHLLLDRRQHAATRERARWEAERAAGQQDLVLDRMEARLPSERREEAA